MIAVSTGHGVPGWQRRAIGLWPVDSILRRRARDIVAKTAIDRELAGAGCLVDIGAGTCHLTEILLDRCPGLSCIAIEPSWRPAGPLERRLDASRFQFLRGSGLALPLAGRTCDAALVAFVLHHLEPGDQVRLLEEALRTLRPGGRLILLEDTPDSDDETARTERVDRRLNMEPPASAHHYRTADQWRGLLGDLGLRIERETAFSRVFPPASLGAIPHHAFVSTID
jgi:ubiquinone/menaquinone biosynthesis C-methylase UbiE